MKSKISFSMFATLLTLILLGLLIAGCAVAVNDRFTFFTLAAIFLILVISALFFGTAYISADKDKIILGSPLRKKRILMEDVESVEPFRPTMGEVRLFASGGFMGYWGIFYEGDIGRYYGFYGRASDCFLIRMKDGKKYVLGCSHSEEMIAFIKSHIHPAD